MSRFSAGVETGAGSTTLPLISHYAAAGSGGTLREFGITNTTAVTFRVRLVRLTTTGTQGAAAVEGKHDPTLAPPLCSVFGTHTVAPTLGDDLGYRATIGEAKGGGIIWTFGGTGIIVPAGVANGVGLIIVSGAGQVSDAYFVFDE